MTVLVTGASSGFGEAICRLLVKSGYKVIGAARRIEKLQQLQTELGDAFYPLKMDVTKQKEVDNALQSLPVTFNEIDLLINNAGLALGLKSADKANFDDWLTMINTNIVGLIYLTRKILPQMVAANKGTIINIGSIAGTYPYPGGNVYGASKAFVKQFSLNLRADLIGTAIRVSNIEPGLCGETEFSHIRFNGDDQKAASVYQGVQFVRPEDIANTVLWIYQQPAYMNINSIEIMPVAQAFSALAVHRDNID